MEMSIWSQSGTARRTVTRTMMQVGGLGCGMGGFRLCQACRRKQGKLWVSKVSWSCTICTRRNPVYALVGCAQSPMTPLASAGPPLFCVSPQTLAQVRQVAHAEHASYGAAALWGSLQPDRHTVVADVPIQRRRLVAPEGTPEQTAEHSLPVAFTIRCAELLGITGQRAQEGLLSQVSGLKGSWHVRTPWRLMCPSRDANCLIHAANAKLVPIGEVLLGGAGEHASQGEQCAALLVSLAPPDLGAVVADAPILATCSCAL